MSPGLVLLLAIALFIPLLLLLKWYLDRVWRQAGRTMEMRHRMIYRLLQTRSVPQDWVDRYLNDGVLASARSRKRAKRRALRMIGRQIDYFDRAGPFETLEAKRIFMSGIRRVEKRWKETPEERFEELIDHGSGMQ